MALLVSVIGFLGACGSDDDTTPPDDLAQQTQRLAKTWAPGAITFEGAPAEGFDGFVLTFNANGTYTATNGSPVFQGSGSWEFPNSNLNVVELSNGRVLNITQLNDSNLNFDTTVGGTNARTTGTDGDYTFQLNVQ